MLTRLLSNIDGVKACLLSREGEIVGGDGEGNITLYHQAMKMASDLKFGTVEEMWFEGCLLYTSPSPRDQRGSRMPSSA